MKKNYFVLLFFFGLLINCYGQIIEPIYYIVKQPIVVYPYDLVSEIADKDNWKIASLETPFIQIGDIRSEADLGQVYIIQILKMDYANNFAEEKSTKINSDNSFEIYCVKAENFKPPTIQRFYKRGFKNGKLTFGTIIVPIKMRPKQNDIPFDFTTDFTLGSSFGYSIRMSRYHPNFLNLISVFGITSVGVDSISTNGYIKAPDTKLSSITPGFGIVAEMSDFQIGLVFGWDILGGNTGKNWIYNGKTWISFGIGYQFIRKDE